MDENTWQDIQNHIEKIDEEHRKFEQEEYERWEKTHKEFVASGRYVD